MGFILIGILLAFLIMVFSIRLQSRSRYGSGYSNTSGTVEALVVLLAIFASLTISTGGHAPAKEIERIDLRPIRTEVSSENENNEVYVCVSSGDNYTFYSKVEEGNMTVYVPMAMSETSVQIVEESDCLEPRLIKYSEDGIPTFWSFGVLGGKIYHVFYVPEGAVVYK